MQWHSGAVLNIDLGAFGIVFAANSSFHSYLFLALLTADQVALDVGFYYIANACGRLLATVLFGWVFLLYGFIACLILSSPLL